MKPCSNCNLVLPDDAYAKDVSREDGLARICRECNAEKCRRWHAENRERKRLYALQYKEEHGRGPEPTPRERAERRAELKRAQQLDTTPDDWQMIRFSASEWLYCLQQADHLRITPSDYVRNLVRDARRAAQ